MAQPKSKKNDDLLLKNLVPLNTLTDEQLDQLMSSTVVEKAKKRAYLFREGDTEHQNVYLLSGTVALLSGQKEMDTVVSGTQAARFALAHQLPRKHSARAKTAVTFVRIDSRRLSDLLAHTQSASYVVNESGSPGKNDWMSLLLRSTVFQQIPPSNLQRVMMSMEEIEVSADDVIIQQGDEGDYFYLISNGLCRVMRQPAEDHPPVELAQLKAGQGFGEEALISDMLRSSTVTMLTDGVLVRLNKKDFVELVKQPLWHSIDYAEACQKAEENAIWLDVRTPEEYTAGHIPGAINIPFYSLRFESSSLADNETYLVYGVEGGQSAIAAYLLIEREHEVFVLNQDWRELASLAGLNGAESAASLDNVIDINRDAGSMEDMEPVPEAALQAEAQEAIGNLQQQLRDTRLDYEKKLNQQQTQFSQLKQDLGVAKHELELQEQKARTARDELNQEIEDLRSSLKTAKKAVSDKAEREQNEQKLTRQLAKYKQQLARLKDELNSTAETTERLQSEKDRLQAELETRERQAADDQAEQQRQHKALQQQLEAAQSDSQAGQRQTAEAMASLQDELAAAQAQLAQMQGALETAQKETRTSREALEETRSDLHRLDSQRSELEAQLEQQYQTVAFLKRSLETAEEAVEITDKTADEISQENQETNRQLQDLQGAMASLEAEKAALEQQQADTQASLEAAEASQRETTAALKQQIKEQAQALEKALVELQQAQQQSETAAKQRAELAAMQAGKVELEQQLVDARSALEASEASGREATANLQQQVAQLQQSFETSAAELQRAQKQSAKAVEQQAELAAMQAGKAELEQQLADARSALEASEASGREATANLQQQVAQLQQSFEASAAELQQAKQQSAEAVEQQAELAAMQAGKAELEQQLADARSALEASEASGLEATANLQQQVAQLQQSLEASAAEQQQAQQQSAEAAKQQAELAAMQAGKAELEQQLADARSAIEAGEASGREATASLQQQVAQLQQSLEASAAELQQAKQQQAVSETSQQTQLDALQVAKTDLESRLADAKSRLKSKNQLFDSASAEQKLQIKQLQSELAATREQLDASARAGDRDTASAQELRAAQQQISELKKNIVGLREVQLEMENQFSEDSSEELRGLRARLEMEEKKRRKAESQARQADVLRREREVQETAVEMLGEDLENLTLENQRLQAEKEALASQLSEMRNPTGDAEMAGGHSPQPEELRQNAGLMEKERDEAKAEAARMKGEVLELRCVIETYVKQIQDVQSMGSVDEISALTSELDMVRRQASEDLEHMRRQLTKAQSKSAGSVDREVNEAASLQALRQEIDSQQNALNEREQLLRLSQTQCRTLEDAIEDRDKEVDQLRRKLELLLRKTGGLSAHSVRQDTDPLIDSRLLPEDSEDISSHLQEGLIPGQRQAGYKGRTKLGRLFRKK